METTVNDGAYAVLLGDDPVGFITRQVSGLWKAELVLSSEDVIDVGDEYPTEADANDALTTRLIDETVRLLTPKH